MKLKLSVGTKSLLFGYHQFLIHPIALAFAWRKLYGWPRDWRIWIAFVVHDWGYWGKPNMDGPEGERHPYFGARLMHAFFGGLPGDSDHLKWYNFMLYHSRFLARKAGEKPSQLCYADKLAIIMQPTWLQVLLMSLTGEIHEYRKGDNGRTAGEGLTRAQWVNKMKDTLRAWMAEQRMADLVEYKRQKFADLPTCPGCGCQIEPDVCGCGDSIKGNHEGHPFVPFGCRCMELKD